MTIEEEIQWIKDKLTSLELLLEGKTDRVPFQTTANYLNARISEVDAKVTKNTSDINILKAGL